MPTFGRNHRNLGVDWWALAYSPTLLYRRLDVLNDDTAWLEKRGYQVNRFDCTRWRTERDFHRAVRTVMGWDDYPKVANLYTLETWLDERLVFPKRGGCVWQFLHFDQYETRQPCAAMYLLRLIGEKSRYFLLTGNRFFAMAQSEDAWLQIEAIGAKQAEWNPREWRNKDRVAEHDGNAT